MTARRARPVAGRAGWGLIDQAFSSLTNFALGIIVARTVPIAEFGAFSLAFAAYLLAVNLTRAFPMQPLAIRYSAATADAWRRGSAAALGSVLLVGLVGGLAFVPLGLLLGGTIGLAFVALGLTLPGLLLQDGWRSAFFAAGQGSKAFRNDLVWACTLFPWLGLIAATGQTSIFWLTVAWGGAATIAAVVGLIQTGIRPQPLMARSWWREHRDLGPRYLTEAVVSTGANQAAMYGVGIVAGLSAVGAVRAGLLLFGPLQILLAGISLMVVPEGVRALQHSVGRLGRGAVVLSVGLAAIALIWGIMLQLIPEPVGHVLLGDTWDAAKPLFGPLTLAYAGLMGGIGAAIVLRALANARRSLRANLFGSTANGVAILGAALAGSLGATWGFAAAAGLGLLGWWRQAALAVNDAAEDDSTAALAQTRS